MNLRIGLAAAFAGIVLIWLAASSDRRSHAFSFTGQQNDYYNLLVDGYLEGHLYMKAEVHPGRLSPDIEVRKQSPYLLDAAEYGGHYYLYYGVVPAITLLLPYSAMTGHDLSLNVATLVFVLVGFGFSVIWYQGLRRTCFLTVPAPIDWAMVLLLAFGPATTFLVRRAMFYELPLAAGYAFLCGFIWTATKALSEPAQGARWIALASLCLGLAAGCHPNYALLTPLVALTAWWSHRARPAGQGAGTQMMKAALLPAAIIGAGVAWYNYARFGNPLDFGFNHGVNDFFESSDKLLSAAFLWPNLKWYYLTPPTLLPYFPFVFPAAATFRPPGYHGAEAIHGQFVVSLLLAWIGAGALLYSREVSWPALLRRLGLVLGCAFAVAALFICLLGIRANRYMVDFQFPLIALGVLLAANLGQLRRRDRLLVVWRIGLIGLTLLMSANNVLAAVQQFDDFRNTRSETFAWLARTLNPSWAFWGKLGLVKTGPLAFDVAFQAQAHPVGEPLLTVGIPGYSDTVYALQYPGNLVEFSVEHFGYGGPRSRRFAYEPGRVYHMQIELGCFYPPKMDPYFARRPVDVVRQVKTAAKVVFDGQTAIDHHMALFDAAPWQREFGSNHTSRTPYPTKFSGRISGIRWLEPAPLPDAAALPARSCVMHLAATFPTTMPAGGQPLVAFGISGEGSMLFLRPVASGQWNLMVDEWGYPSSLLSPVAITPGEHIIDIFIGPLTVADPLVNQTDMAEALLAHQRRLIVWLDGKIVGNFLVNHHLEAFANASPGANLEGFSTSEPNFYGQIKDVALAAPEKENILRQVLTDK